MLRLAKLPDRVSIKVMISVSPELNRALSGNAKLYAEPYGQEEPVSKPIPAILTTFLESDRAFTRRRKDL